MKKLNLLYFLSLILVLAACSKDDGPGETNTAATDDAAINATEETVLDADVVTKDITIVGANKIAGSPNSTGKLDFTLDYKTQSAFLKTGFDINFKAPITYAGAYIQLKSEDGTLAEEYFDVPKDAGIDTGRKLVASKKSGLGKKALKVDEIGTSIDVIFGAGVPPGKFCYIICIYDDAGNISSPQEVCVEIEAWGGNAALAGTWEFTKSEDIINGVSSVILKGQEDCEDTSAYCPSMSESIIVKKANCDTTNSIILVLNQNGTYRYDVNYNYKNLDYNAFQVACEPIFEEKNNAIDYGIGNWAFNEDTKELTIVEFEYSEDGEKEEYDNGDVYALETKITDNNSLIFQNTESYTGGDGITMTNVYKSFFVRK